MDKFQAIRELKGWVNALKEEMNAIEPELMSILGPFQESCRFLLAC